MQDAVNSSTSLRFFSITVTDCLKRLVSEMTLYTSSGALPLYIAHSTHGVADRNTLSHLNLENKLTNQLPPVILSNVSLLFSLSHLPSSSLHGEFGVLQQSICRTSTAS